MSKKVQNDLVNTISEKISKECMIQRSSLRDLVKFMFSQKKYFKDYEYLSSGAYALVLKAQNTEKNRSVALKFLSSSNQEDKNGIESLKKEYEMLQKFSQSEFLVNVYDCFYLIEEQEDEDDEGNEKIIQTGVKSFFVMEMELCEQNLKQLFNFLRNQQPPKEIKEIIAIQLIEGLNNLHVKNIMHRDIKPQNFLVCPSQQYGFTIKLCDLGFASAVSKSKSFLSKKGTDAYFAPEVEEGQSRIQSDLYSLGLVLLELDNLKTLDDNWLDYKAKNYLLNGKELPSEKYQIDKKSNIYKIAQICLKPWYLDRTTAGELLSKLIKLHGQPLKFVLTSMIIEEQIPRQAQSIFDKINQLQQQMHNQFDDYAQFILDNTKSKIKQKDSQAQFTKVEVLSKLLKSLYEDKKYTNNFQILSFGSFGMILATKKVKLDNKEIVLKIQKIQNEQQIQNEINIMQKLKEPLVVQLYDSYTIEKIAGPDRYAVFELEKCSCSLEEYLERQDKDGELSEKQKFKIAIQIIDNVNYVHSFNIIHRDIKPDNFLVCLDGDQVEIKLCDFGLSAQIPNNQSSIQDLEYIGNLGYSAPEIITKKDNEIKIYSKKSDSYSVGLLLAFLDNYQDLKEKHALTFFNMTQKQFDKPFEKSKVQIKKNTEIYKFVNLLAVSDCKSRALLSDIVEQDTKKFISNSKDMKQVLQKAQLTQNKQNNKQNKSIEKNDMNQVIQKTQVAKNEQNIKQNKTIRITSIKDLNKIYGFNIVVIDLVNKGIGQDGAKKVSDALSKCSNITQLNLNLDSNGIGSDGAKKISGALRNCPNITQLTLNLRDNKIDENGAKSISDALKNCKSMIQLELNLNWNKIGREGAISIASALENNQNINQLKLGLYENNIGDDGAKSIANVIRTYQNISLLVLELGVNNIGDDGAKSVANAIQNCKQITYLYLNLGENNIGGDGAKSVANAIQNCKQITSLTLDLDYNNIGDDGAKSVANAIQNCQQITSLTLDLRDNSISDDGAKSVANAIQNCQKITHLKLWLKSNKIGDDGAKSVANAIQNCKQITSLTLYLGRNKIGDDGAKSVANAILNCQQITELLLYLDNNQISDSGAQSIVNAIQNCQKIIALTFEIEKNSISQGQKQLLENSLRSKFGGIKKLKLRFD